MKKDITKEQKELTLLTPEELDQLTHRYGIDRMNMIREMPFYGVLLLSIQAQATSIASKIPIAAINYSNIFLQGTSVERVNKIAQDNPDLASELLSIKAYTSFSDRGRITILLHEILHLVFQHLSIPRSYDREIANIAMDAVINRILLSQPEASLDELPPGIVRPQNLGSVTQGITIGTDKGQEFIPIPDFESKDWEPIYWDVHDYLQKQAKANNSSLDPDKLAEAIKKMAKDLANKNPMNGDCAQGDFENDPDFQRKKITFQRQFVTAYEAAKNQGTLPSEFQRFVESLETSKVPWTYYLRNLLKTELTRSDFSMRNDSRRSHLRFGPNRRPPIMPVLKNETIGEVWCALDTSGSMSETDLIEGISEFRGLRMVTPFTLHFVSCDASTGTVKTFDKHEEPDWTHLPIKGGGGTSFVPVFEKVEEARKSGAQKPALLVYFTDTMGTFPEKAPDYPVIWVTNYDHASVPWGKLLKID